MSNEYQRIKTPSRRLPKRGTRGKPVNITITFVFVIMLLLLCAQFYYLDYNLNIIHLESEFLYHNPSHLIKKKGVENLEKNKDDHKRKMDGKNLTDNLFERFLTSAGISIEELSKETVESLPSEADVNDLYGSEPVIIGLDKCSDFQAMIKPEDSFLAPAGMFNTGTNLISELLQKNCQIPAKIKIKHAPGMRAQVPWGKHTPVQLRGINHAISGGEIPHENVFPVLVIKDPYTWMQSMCRHEYSANWNHSSTHCPNLVPVEENEKEQLIHNGAKNSSIPVDVNFSKQNVVKYDSLVDLWNTWYGDWMNSTFPFMAIRFEDLLFRPQEVIEKMCHCVSGEMIHDEKTGDRKGFQFISESAKQGKAHEGSNGLLVALTRYGNKDLRKAQFLNEDIEYARLNLDSKLMEMFQYKTL